MFYNDLRTPPHTISLKQVILCPLIHPNQPPITVHHFYINILPLTHCSIFFIDIPLRFPHLMGNKEVAGSPALSQRRVRPPATGGGGGKQNGQLDIWSSIFLSIAIFTPVCLELRSLYIFLTICRHERTLSSVPVYIPG